jgi:hypothetical protein
MDIIIKHTVDFVFACLGIICITYFIIYVFAKKTKKHTKEEMIDFHVLVIKEGLIEEGELKWEDSYEPKVRDLAERKYNEIFDIKLTNNEKLR